MKDKIFGVLQRVGRSFMLPIAILPVAGLLLGLGSSFTNTTTIETYGLQWLLGDKTILHALLVIMNAVGSAIFDNLPLHFCGRSSNRNGKEGKRGVSTFSSHSILCYECINQCDAQDFRKNSCRRKHCKGCA